MKTITQVTEKRINEMLNSEDDTKWVYGKVLEVILRKIKMSCGYIGTIKELKFYGEKLPNTTGLNIDDFPEEYVDVCRGMSVNFNEYINTITCLDIQALTLKNFNELVKACYNM